MRRLLPILLLVLAAGLALFAWRGPTPVLTADGVTTEPSWFGRRRTVDYVSVLRTAMARESSILTMTVREDRLHDQMIEKTFLLLPSDARIRVAYTAEYPIGYRLTPGSYTVTRRGDGSLLVTLPRPSVIAQPSVRLTSAMVLDTGFMIDEQAALVKLQQRIQPEVVGRADVILARPDVVPTSERALRTLLQPFLDAAARGGSAPAPRLQFRYRQDTVR